MQKRDLPILLPPNPAEHVTDWLLEIGPTSISGMGEAPVSWETIDAWQRLTGIELDPWEARTIRRLSSAYVGQRYEARKPNCPPPYNGADESVVAKRDTVTAQFKAFMQAFAKPKGKA